ncbi:MAG: sigma 54-interacting transcriptional regulator [Planctomycetes bacterium]|nr:sigma 54-interacting transcriptional regulator [Planctomycetota bacterium]
MKRRPLAEYLELVKEALRKKNYRCAKRQAESALDKLQILTHSPLDEYTLYFRLGNIYTTLAEYSRAIDAFYKASLIAPRCNLSTADNVYLSLMMALNFTSTKNINQALLQYQKVHAYYQKYGESTPPLTRYNYVTMSIGLAYCHLYKRELMKVIEIIEKQLVHYHDILSKDNLCRLNYYHFKGEYLIEKGDYIEARKSFEECIKVSENIKFPRGILEAKVHLAIIDLLENKTNDAIKIFRALFRDTRRLRQPELNELFCEAALLLSKSYTIKNQIQKAESIEEQIKPALKTLDIIWFYEKKREFESLVKRLETIHKAPGVDIKAIPNTITQTINHYRTTAKDVIVGKSDVMQEVYHLIDKIAPTDLPVLIQGETGTGKELIARSIYQTSQRRDNPWLAVNCGAVPETLLENELFGHIRGGFTGAVGKRGYIEIANGGTLFLDEIASMTLAMQQKLLRVLEEKEVWRIGAEKPITVNTRFIFASNQNIENLVKKKLFREDLFYRINTIIVTLPPLRERKEDICLLTEYFVRKYFGDKATPAMSQEVLNALQNYAWPGNVREMENEIKRIAVLNRGIKHISEAMLSKQIRDSRLTSVRMAQDAGSTFKRLKDEFERNVIVETLRKYNGNITRAARELGCDRTGLSKKIKTLRIELPTTFSERFL